MSCWILKVMDFQRLRAVAILNLLRVATLCKKVVCFIKAVLLLTLRLPD